MYRTCPSTRRRLYAFPDEELPVSDQIAVRSHLEWCDACAAVQAAMSGPRGQADLELAAREAPRLLDGLTGALALAAVLFVLTATIVGMTRPERIEQTLDLARADLLAVLAQRDLMEQVLFTTPGERVNRPTFGSGLLQLVFAPNSDVLAGVVETTVQAALQQHMADYVLVEGVNVEADDGTLFVTVRYVLRRTQQRQTAQFSREV